MGSDASTGEGRRGLVGAVARECALLALGIGAAAVALWALGIGCPIKFMTGVSCPGCGLTRAWLEVLRLDVPAAFAYHPLFWLVPPALVVAVASSKVRSPRARRALNAAIAVMVVALVALWAVRLALPDDLQLFVGAAGPGDVVNVQAPRWLAALRSGFDTVTQLW